MRKKKLVSFQRALGIVLACSLVVAAAAPMTYATTAERESALLATDQRSINNPEGRFEVPGASESFRLLHPGTRSAIWLAYLNFLQQLFLGSGEAESFRRILAYTPIITKDDDIPSLEALGNDTLSQVLNNGMRDIFFAFLETEDPNIYRLVGIHSTRTGEKYGISSGVIYNTATGLFGSENAFGILSSGYEYNVDQEMLRTAVRGWNSLFGFNIFFDMAAPLLLFNLQTQRFRFSYQGKDWMIQIWKGFYTISNGAEIGIYEKPAGRPVHYDASDTMLEISMKLYQKDELYFDYGTQRTWWAGGFSYASPIYRQLPPRQLRLTGTILFEEQGMLEAFLESFEKNRPSNMTGGAEGLLFSYDWQTGLGLF